MAWDFSDLLRLHAAVEAKCSAQAASGSTACRAGCRHCCRRIATLLPVEAAFLSAGHPDWIRLRRLPPAAALGSDLHPGEPLCGLLEAAGTCGAYPHRPLICRTHGFLLLSNEGIDHCPWNFEELEEVEEDLPFHLEDLNETLLRINLAFLARSWPGIWRELAHARVDFQESC